jgi:hypothetical protein
MLPVLAVPAMSAGPVTDARLASAAVPLAHARTAARSIGDVNSRYWSMWASGTGVSSGWLGSILGCLLGTNTPRANNAALRAINYARWLSGLSPVALDGTLNRRALGAALIMQANNVLTHAPGSGLLCWSPGGAAGASHGNLAWRYPAITPVGAIGLYLSDPGAANYSVPHRRWVLYPPTARMGVGSTRQFSAAYVVGPVSSRQARPAYVRWPSAGWFPNPLAPNRWSLGGPGLKLGKATVSVYRGGTRLATRKQPLAVGYGQPTLVWSMPRGYARTGTYKVVVRNIHRAGTRAAFSHTYWVKLFTPHR